MRLLNLCANLTLASLTLLKHYQINAGIVKGLIEACGKHCPGVSVTTVTQAAGAAVVAVAPAATSSSGSCARSDSSSGSGSGSCASCNSACTSVVRDQTVACATVTVASAGFSNSGLSRLQLRPPFSHLAGVGHLASCPQGTGGSSGSCCDPSATTNPTFVAANPLPPRPPLRPSSTSSATPSTAPCPSRPRP